MYRIWKSWAGVFALYSTSTGNGKVVVAKGWWQSDCGGVMAEDDGHSKAELKGEVASGVDAW